MTDEHLMETDQVDKPETSSKNEEIRGRPKSGRWWKTTQKHRHSAIVKVKPLKSSWEKKMKNRADAKATKTLQQEIREKLAAEKAAKIEAKKEREQRRKENERKAEIVQVIKNSAKLKRVKKKQLRKIEMRDTNDLIKS